VGKPFEWSGSALLANYNRTEKNKSRRYKSAFSSSVALRPHSRAFILANMGRKDLLVWLVVAKNS
jgi:hypothetical protein